MIETLNKVIQVQKQLLQEHGNEPTAEEVAAEMEMPLDRAAKHHEDGTTADQFAKPSGRQ